MAFVLPTFNLTANVWRGPAVVPPVGLPVLSPPCNLTPGRRIPLDQAVSILDLYLLLPAFTDIRSTICAAAADMVEVPAGSGRYYEVSFVDDIGKGFANEHRFAVLLQFGPWPAPIP